MRSLSSSIVASSAPAPVSAWTTAVLPLATGRMLRRQVGAVPLLGRRLIGLPLGRRLLLRLVRDFRLVRWEGRCLFGLLLACRLGMRGGIRCNIAGRLARALGCTGRTHPVAICIAGNPRNRVALGERERDRG